eukprot:TRINITY_DN3809_c0_g1_i1.p1 TRINITY_DN3809_c0_g1~~TRINITY_DN3809_c0_g1_i1.p1  ORF type:complete len:174 (-),score=26.55 TRINITY_DN3809_c0_g1_i1:80-601(-)
MMRHIVFGFLLALAVAQPGPQIRSQNRAQDFIAGFVGFNQTLKANLLAKVDENVFNISNLHRAFDNIIVPSVHNQTVGIQAFYAVFVSFARDADPEVLNIPSLKKAIKKTLIVLYNADAALYRANASKQKTGIDSIYLLALADADRKVKDYYEAGVKFARFIEILGWTTPHTE